MKNKNSGKAFFIHIFMYFELNWQPHAGNHANLG